LTSFWGFSDRLAQELIVSLQTIKGIDRGKNDTSLPSVFKISSVIGLPIKDIFESFSEDSN
jgi:DNA-binding XRE family transcriptional regulator